MNDTKSSRNPLHGPTIIGLGSNVREQLLTPSLFISEVVNSLVEYNIEISNVSRPWASYSWPNKCDPMYINAVLFASTSIGPEDLLKSLNHIENRFGRRRTVKNAPRTLDLDLIAYGDIIIKSEALTLPHPSAHERAFVMGPICDVDKDWVHPILGIDAKTLFQQANVGRDAYPVEDDAWPTL